MGGMAIPWRHKGRLQRRLRGGSVGVSAGVSAVVSAGVSAGSPGVSAGSPCQFSWGLRGVSGVLRGSPRQGGSQNNTEHNYVHETLHAQKPYVFSFKCPRGVCQGDCRAPRDVCCSFLEKRLCSLPLKLKKKKEEKGVRRCVQASVLFFGAGCGGPILEFYRPSLGLVNRHLSQE